jgi:hypothetical protein
LPYENYRVEVIPFYFNTGHYSFETASGSYLGLGGDAGHFRVLYDYDEEDRKRIERDVAARSYLALSIREIVPSRRLDSVIFHGHPRTIFPTFA